MPKVHVTITVEADTIGDVAQELQRLFSPTMQSQEPTTSAKEETVAATPPPPPPKPKKARKSRTAKKAAEPVVVEETTEPSPEPAVEAAGEDQEQPVEEGQSETSYTSYTRWRDLVSALIEDGYTTKDALLEQCRAIKDDSPVLKKVPEANLETRVDRAIEVFGLA